MHCDIVYIMLGGFKAAYDQHGLRYTEFIGDKDSSVQPTLDQNLS